MIRISVPLLDKQDIELEGEEPPEFLELGENTFFRLVSPVRYRLLARRVSGGALVTGRVAVKIAGECGRCLKEVEEEVVNPGLELFLPIANEQELDISEDVRSEMLVELPINLLCGEGCAGLCPGCGADLNEESCRCKKTDRADNVWGALDQLDLK